MLRHERRVLIDCLGVGIALTFLVIAADVSGALTPLEDWLYDLRARFCQNFTPPPTDKLVHLDIDDPAIDAIGRMPWPRGKVAQLLDEIRLAGPKAVELDLLFSEPQALEFVPVRSRSPDAATTAPSTAPAATTTIAATQPVDCVPFDNDAELASAIGKLGNVIIPATLEAVPIESERYRAMVAELAKDLEQDDMVLSKRIRELGFQVHEKGVGEQFFLARRDAIARRLKEMNATPSMSFETVRALLLPRTPREVNSGAVNVVREQWYKFLAAEGFKRFSFPAPAGCTRTVNMRIKQAPVEVLSQAAAGGAFVDYTQFGSPVIRSLPLLFEQDGRFYPQMGLALACRMLDADTDRMRVQNERLIIPRTTGGEMVIPLAPPRVGTDGRLYGNLIDIPWFGGRHWETMYDWPAHKDSKQHLPMHQVWQACVARQKVIQNNGEIDGAIGGLFWATEDISRLQRHDASIPPPEDFFTREKTARAVVEEFAPYMEVYATMAPAEMKRRDQVFVASFNALQQLLKLTPPLVQELQQFRQVLVSNLRGKAVLIGWTATAAIADFVPTSLHEKTPGVVVHGVIFNGIMNGELWSRLPWWVSSIFAAVMGLLTAATVGFFSPVRALFVAAALILAYVAIDGVLLFDYGNRIVAAAAPLTTVAVVWGGCTLTRVAVEQTERARITRRFSNYADSRLVDHVLENPDVSFEGEEREMTIAFTDLAGFTSLSERLGPKIVPVLNELLGELVPVIRDHHQGYVNKFIGDGIMFFYNAPLRNNEHASEAVSTVLDMHQKVAEFNVKLRERSLPELAMRGGIASGVVVVGDAGGGGRSDYTCLGDAVNLSSRLEAANKAVGTRTLMNDRAAELLNGEFLLRPIGKIKVVGKDEAVMCYEPIARNSTATDDQRDLADRTKRLVEAFTSRKFDDCLRVAAELDTRHGVSKLTDMYRAMCRQYLESPPPADFDGRIVLTEK